MKKYVYAGVIALSPVAAFAVDAQPDTAAATAYIAAGGATILGVFGSKYVLRGIMLIGRWVQSVIR